MQTIEFQDRKMNLVEAKTYLEEIKSGKITLELNQEERADYERIKEIFQLKDEKSYLELLLTIPISVTEHFNKIGTCKKKGHLGEKVLCYESSGKTLCRCNACGDMYDRPMNMEEQRDFNKLMKTHMTI